MTDEALAHEASLVLAQIKPVYRDLMKFEECASWAAANVLDFTELLADHAWDSLADHLAGMAENLEFELEDGGYGGAFVGELEASIEALHSLREQLQRS